MSRPLIIAHRGDSSRALENSLEAFRLALALPVDMIEFDIRKSRDNQLYVMHDKDTGRTAGKNLDIEESESNEISKLKLKNNEPIPLLADVLKLVTGRVGINIEIKSVGAGAELSRQLFHYRYSGYIMVSSFKEKEVLDAREIMLDLPISGIFDTFIPAEVSKYQSMGYGLISLRKKTVTRELVSACHDQKIKVYVWTVDEEDEIKRFIEWGVDGMYSNKPMVLKRVVDELS